MNYFDTKNKSLCCGCTACASVCPVQCITMQEDKDGFIYPKIDKEKCINCGLCKKVCPFIHSEELKHEVAKDCYAMVLDDKKEMFKSASGGAFFAIMNAFCDENYVIYGSEMCQDLQVRHSRAESIEEAQKFRKSKYVKSEINGTYILAKKDLEEGKKVLFSGTGCQIGGLKGFLQKDYENLLTVDLVCHGVPSNKIFKNYIGFIEKKYNKKIERYQFRSKYKNDPLSVKISFENGKKVQVFAQIDKYMIAFLTYLDLMPSCYNCKFADSKRTGDITIADFWGIEKFNYEFDSHKGTSLIIPNSLKGIDIINQLEEVKLFETKLENALVQNDNLKEPTKTHEKREDFLADLNSGTPFDKAVNKYAPIRFKTKIKSIIKKILPQKLIKIIRKIK